MPEQNEEYPGIPALDTVHDFVYDRAYKPYRDHRQKKKESQHSSDEMSDDGQGSLFDGVVKNRPGFAAGDGFLPGDQPFPDIKEDDNNTQVGRGADTERYEPSSYGRQAANDGYARDAYSDNFEERGDWGGSAVKGKGYAKGYRVPKSIGYGGQYDRQNKSYDNLKEAEYQDSRRVGRYQPETRYRDDSRDRYGPPARRSGRDRSLSRSSDEGSDKREGHWDGDDNTEVKKWGATLAGAAIGGFTGHKAKKEGFIGTAIGAILGGLVAREAEKEIYKRKSRNKSRRREDEGSYRSKSR